MKRITIVGVLIGVSMLSGGCGYFQSLTANEPSTTTEVETPNEKIMDNNAELSSITKNSSIQQPVPTIKAQEPVKNIPNTSLNDGISGSPSKPEPQTVIATSSKSDTLAPQKNIENIAIINLPIRSTGDSISVNYSITIPEGMVSPNERFKLKPVMVFDSTMVMGKIVSFQGVDVKNPKAITIAHQGGIYKGSSRFYYNGTPPHDVHFYLFMETTLFGNNKFGQFEEGVKIDTLFSSSGISVIDRLLNISPLIMTASMNNQQLDSIDKILSRELAKNTKISSTMRDSIIGAAKRAYMEAIIDNNLGVMAYRNGNIKRAQELFKKSSSTSDFLNEPLNNIAIIALSQGDYQLIRNHINTGHILDYINGNYKAVKDGLDGTNLALVQIIEHRLNSALETLDGINSNQADLLRLVIYAHRGDRKKIEELLSNNSELRSLEEYHIVAHEIDLYR